MKEKNGKNRWWKSSRECAYLAVFVALVIALQLALSFLPWVELVTVLFVSYSFIFGWRRGMVAATAFSLLRQLVFGFFPTVLVLYLVYYNLLAFVFGVLGRSGEYKRGLWKWSLCACLGAIFFTLLDNVITPLWYGYTWGAFRAYFIASLPFLIPQLVCTAVTVTLLFIPLCRAFSLVKRDLERG